MSKPNIILIGAGGHAHACIDVIEQQDEFQIAGLVGMPDEVEAKHFGYSVIAVDADLPELVKSYTHALVTVGQINSATARISLYDKVAQLGFALPVVISPSAYVSKHAVIGEGTIVMHGAIVNAGAKVGKNCIVNSRALIEHDAAVGDHCHISTGALVNGSVQIGQGCFVGSGSVLKDGITLGSNCVIGMGLSVRHNQADKTQFTGRET
ncbi:MAG: acetyltransferase [Gammaproteobacteria bacterium]